MHTTPIDPSNCVLTALPPKPDVAQQTVALCTLLFDSVTLTAGVQLLVVKGGFAVKLCLSAHHPVAVQPVSHLSLPARI